MPNDFVTDFALFYSEYPRKEARKDALKAWNKLNPDQETQQAIHDALRWQKVSDQWRRGFVPLPGSYLRGERWTDTPPTNIKGRSAPTPAELAQVARIRERQRQDFLLDQAEYYQSHPEMRPSKPS